jgi:hypothetical protein
MSKVQKSPARSPRTNFLKLDEKSQHYDFGDDDEEVKRENGNSDMDIESAISVSTEINSPKKDSNGEDADVKMQSPVKVEQHVKPETSKRKLEGDEEEEEEFFGFELSPLKDFNKVKKLKEHTPKTPVSANQGNSVHQQVVVPQKAVPNRPIPLSDPIYQEPFKFGWKRELVINEKNLFFVVQNSIRFLFLGASKYRSRWCVSQAGRGVLHFAWWKANAFKKRNCKLFEWGFVVGQLYFLQRKIRWAS